MCKAGDEQRRLQDVRVVMCIACVFEGEMLAWGLRGNDGQQQAATDCNRLEQAVETCLLSPFNLAPATPQPYP